ncbi:putative FAD-linked oxidoreductase [Aquisphaera giovannonii]|uniref:Putative FAD-linked oxidoreductase n=1 Tax=Aquisphaera giovannonii TaxID=406548 RepID=A0A5B9W7X8_9BACT|nr:FAD-linked oxidase C-terminal domain-containing protein [Aquisphaera giovannonii]QEH36688.1 putative FAD-linked oxidoreductase [Aquisphaera giovannonii]
MPAKAPATATSPLAARLLGDLVGIVGAENVLHDREELLVYECDGFTINKKVPDVVVFPTSTEQVVAIVKLCNRLDVPFVPRGAGTSLAGGTLAVGGGVMICLTRMNRILEVNTRDRYAIVEPGVVNVWLTRALTGRGFHYAPDPSSQTACTIGGNVATNSGGPHTLKYGVTVNHVRGVRLVLPDGTVADVGGVTADPPGYDLAGLVVGSEGTFGVVTRVTVGLTRDPEAGRTLLGVFDSVEAATETVSGIIAAGIVPAALEMLDNLMIRAVEQAFGFGFPTDAGAVLIIEVDGLDVGLDREARDIARIVEARGGRVERSITWRTRKEPEYVAIWKSRKSAFGAIGRLSPTFCTQDGVVPRTRLPDILRFIEGVSRRHGIRIANVFHAGDGNIHPILLFDEADAAQVASVLQASHEILDECIRLGGSVTGEHGIGVEKMALMPRLFAPEDLAAMVAIRQGLNPDGRCSPSKMLPTGGHCIERSAPGRRSSA